MKPTKKSTLERKIKRIEQNPSVTKYKQSGTIPAYGNAANTVARYRRLKQKKEELE